MIRIEPWMVELDNRICRNIQQEVRKDIVGWDFETNQDLEQPVEQVVWHVSGLVFDQGGFVNRLPGLEIAGISYWLTNALPTEPFEIEDYRTRHAAFESGSILTDIQNSRRRY